MKLSHIQYLIFGICCNGLVVPNAAVLAPRNVNQAFDIALLPRQATSQQPTDPPIHTDVLDIGHDFAEREILLQTSSGFTLTCIQCVMKGKFEINVYSGVNKNVLSGLSSSISAVAASATSVESSIISAATSVAGSIATAATSVAESIASSIASELSSAAPPVVSAVTAGFGQLTSAIIPAITGLGDIFPREASETTQLLTRRDTIQDLIVEITNNINISLVQKEPVHIEMNLEFASGDTALNLNFPTDNLGAFFVPPILGDIIPSSFTLGPLKLALKLNILGLSMSAKLTPHINATLPFSSDVSFNKDFLVGGFGVRDPMPEISTQFGEPVLSEFDPELCLSAAVGPSAILEVSEDVTQTEGRIGVSLDLPKVSLCFQRSNNVTEQCQPNGPIMNALEISSTVELAARPELSLKVAGVSVPGIPQITSLNKTFSVLDKCFDINGGIPGLRDGNTNASFTVPVPPFSTSQAPTPLGNNMATSTMAIKMNGHGNDTASSNLQSTTSVSGPNTSAQPTADVTTQACVGTVIITTTVTVSAQDTSLTTAVAAADSVTTPIFTTSFDEPIGVVFSTKI